MRYITDKTLGKLEFLSNLYGIVFALNRVQTICFIPSVISCLFVVVSAG